MIRGSRFIRLAGATALALALAAPAARASHCNNLSVSLSSGYQAQAATAPSPNPHPFPGCSAHWAAPQESVDTRIITPGANVVSPGFLADVAVATLPAKLNGMGFSNKSVTLTRSAIAGGGAVYAGPWLALPNGPATAGGTITVTVTLPSRTESATFKTPA